MSRMAVPLAVERRDSAEVNATPPINSTDPWEHLFGRAKARLLGQSRVIEPYVEGLLSAAMWERPQIGECPYGKVRLVQRA
jgi:hypothetical protein